MIDASIVIRTFNRSGLVSRAIERKRTRSDLPCEIFVCDHGSTDETPQVAARYGDRIRYVRCDQDRGPIRCWRDGIEQARRDVVDITYDDDWIEPEFMSSCCATTSGLYIRGLRFTISRRDCGRYPYAIRQG